jgi:hypothetical protein
MKRVFFVSMFLAVLGFSVLACAQLQDNGNNLIYDADLDITWYNPSVPTMNWHQAMAWAESLRIGGLAGWRLPSALNRDGSYPLYGYEAVESELGYLYHEELSNILHGPLVNTTPFPNLRPVLYWTSTVTEKYTGNAFAFNFNNGKQGHADKNLTANISVIAVHSGNISAVDPMSE